MIKAKRIWAALIALCMLLTLIPIAAFAEGETSGTCGENLTWTYDQASKTLTISGTGDMYSYNMTAGTGVTSLMIAPWIADESIKNNLEKVIIQDGVTSVGQCAFYKCTALKEVSLPDSLTEIKSYAFYGCAALKTISIEKVTKLWDNTFTGCDSLENITLAEGLTYVSIGTFSDCKNLKSLTISASVTSFEDGFYGCTSLESITVADGNTAYSSQDGVLFNKDKTTLIKFPLNKSITGFTIPDTVTEVEGNAFYGYQKEEYNEKGLLIVGKWIVGTKDIVGENYEIDVNDSVTHIANGIFAINNLKSISVPKNITSIGIGAFGGEGLTSISVNEENTAYSSENGILYNKDKTELIQYPIGKTDEEIILADTVKKIGSLAFSYNQHLKKAELTDVEEIGDFALAYTDVENVTLSPSLKKIGSWAFAWCEKLEKADLPEGVEYIGSRSFIQCRVLKSIHIPESVTFVGEYAFNKTYICDEISVSGKVYYHDNWLLYVGGSHDLSGSFEIKDGTVGICERALYHQPDITSVSIPLSVKYINESAFDGEGSLSEINYGGNKISWDKIIKYEDMPTTIKINYTKEKPTGAPNIRAITEAGKTLADANLTAEASTLSTVGAVKWVEDDGITPLDTTTVVEANKYYKWLFTPTDTDNYETLTGTLCPYTVYANRRRSSGSGIKAQEYTVLFNTNGGSKVTSQTVAENSALKEPTTPTKEGFIFGGWYTDKELKNKYDFSAKVTGGFTLYAAWTEDNPTNQIILTIGENDAQVFGETKTNDVAPKIVNDRTMLPARFVAENLGAAVEWNEKDELVTITGKNLKTGEDVTILIKINSDIAYVNEKEVKLDSAAFIENDRTYTPIRFISEELGADVTWVESEQKVVITK